MKSILNFFFILACFLACICSYVAILQAIWTQIRFQSDQESYCLFYDKIQSEVHLTIISKKNI